MAFPISGTFTEDQIRRLNELSNDPANKERRKNQMLDKDAFLKLMLVQLQNQNPLNPMDNSEYMGQMAQFSTVEQLSNLVTSQESANKMTALISSQIEGMAALIEKLKGVTNDTEASAVAQKEMNAKILEELQKMNALLAGYVEGSNEKPAAAEDMLSTLNGG